MAPAVRTPLHHGGSLALGNKRYRKQLLKAGPLHYQGGVVDISPEMIGGIVDAFDAKAQTRVPFQLADAQNNHTMDPERRRGFVTALHQTSEGLDGIIELEDSVAALVDSDPEFGVSVLVSPVTTGEGQSYDACLQHVLGTYSPVVTTLGPWEIAASQVPADGVIDFLALAADPDPKPDTAAQPDTDAQPGTEPAAGAPDTTKSETAVPDTSSDEGDTIPSEGDAMPSLADLLSDASEDDLKALRAKLDELAPAEESGDGSGDDTDGDSTADDLGEGDDTDGAVDDGPTDDEIAAMLESADDADTATTDQPETVAAAQHSDTDDQLALANAQINEQGLALAQMRRELDDTNWKRERDSLLATNVPPKIVELAKPFLHGSDTRLALSQAGHANAAAQVRKMLDEFGKLSASLRLGQPGVGTTEDTSEDAEARKETEDRTSAVRQHITSSGLGGTRRRTANAK